jgi:pimeloyl-ACP methyl ester carboxylesterase
VVLRPGTDLLIDTAKPERGWSLRHVAAALLATGFAVSAALAWPAIRSHAEAFTVLRQVSGQPVPWLARAAVIRKVSVQDVTVSLSQGNVRGRLYLPEKMPDAPTLMVLHGVHHLGIDEPRLESFAAAMASCGIRVLTPELPGIKDYHVDRDSVRVIGESARWFASKTGGPVAVMGLSFSGGLALVAAGDPAYSPNLRMVFAVGSQDAMEHVSEYYMTGRTARPDGTVEELPAHEYGPLVLEYEHLGNYVPAADLDAVRTVLREHLYEDKQAETSAMRRLTARQRAETLELMDARSEKTRLRLAAANERYRREMQQLSPHGTLRTVTAPVFLLHGAADNIIPSSETLWMASELPEPTLRAMLISPVLSHLDMDGAQPRFADQMRLLHFFASVMQVMERDGDERVRNL